MSGARPTGPTRRSEVLAATAVECRDVDCAINGRVILAGVDLTVAPGSRTAVVGMNGAGKSTLLRTLAGMIEPARGQVVAGGRSLADFPPRQRARTIAFVGQEEAPPMELRVAELVELGRIPHRAPWARSGEDEADTVLAALDRVGMSEYADRRCHQLSGGERRRVVLARGLAQGAPILALDEPTNHLDVAWQLRLLGLLGEHPGTIIASIHDLDLVLRHFDQVVVVGSGRVLAVGDPVATLTPSLVKEAFGVDTRHVIDPESGGTHLLVRAVSEPHPGTQTPH